MADNDGGVEADIPDPIPEVHGDVHGRFVELWNERTSGDAGEVAFDAAWQPIASLLAGHASVDTEVADPVLIKDCSDETPGETDGARQAESSKRGSLTASADASSLPINAFGPDQPQPFVP